MTPDDRFALALAVRNLLDQRGADADDWSMIAGFLATNAFASLPERKRASMRPRHAHRGNQPGRLATCDRFGRRKISVRAQGGNFCCE